MLECHSTAELCFLQCYCSAVLQYCRVILLQCFFSAVPLCCSVIILQCHIAAVVLCCCAIVLQCYCASVIMTCSDIELKWYCAAFSNCPAMILSYSHKGCRAVTSWKQFQTLALDSILLSCMQWDCLYTFICVYICWQISISASCLQILSNANCWLKLLPRIHRAATLVHCQTALIHSYILSFPGVLFSIMSLRQTDMLTHWASVRVKIACLIPCFLAWNEKVWFGHAFFSNRAQTLNPIFAAPKIVSGQNWKISEPIRKRRTWGFQKSPYFCS